MKIHILPNPASISSFQSEDTHEKILVTTKFLQDLFYKKFNKKPIIASGYYALLIYLGFIIVSKFKRDTEFHIYHEANNYFFDILWLMTRIKVHRHDYYSLNTFEKIDIWQIKSHKYARLLILINLHKYFEIYRSYDDFDREPVIWYRVKSEKCVSCIRKVSVPGRKSKIDNNKIIFIVGKDVVSDCVLRDIFLKIFNKFEKYGFEMAVKDHPNPKSRLYPKGEDSLPNGIEYLDPISFSENYNEDYSFAIGFGSTGIFGFQYPISLLNFVPEDIIIKQRRNYVLTHGQHIESQARFPKTISEIRKITIK